METDSSKIKFEVGKTFKLRKGFGDRLYKCHVLAIVDKDYIVYKWYGRHKQWWHYEVEHWWYLEQQVKKYTKHTVLV